jgi:hypothetical protein
MLIAAIHAGAPAAVAAAAGNQATVHRPLLIAALPIAGLSAWPTRRCGDGAPRRDEATAAEAIDASCNRFTVRERGGYRITPARWSAAGGGGGGGGGGGWRVARSVLPALGGLVGPGGMGLGFGSELQLVRGAHMTLHLAAPRDTRMAQTRFAPETTVLARCGACWSESEAIGAGLGSGRRAPASR